MRKIVGLVLLPLCGCAQGVPPVTFGSPAEIAAQFPVANGIPPATYATVYYDRNFRACTDYFNALLTKENQAGVVGMLGGAAGAAAAAASGPIGLVGGLSAATAAGSGYLMSQATAPNGGELPVPAYTLWSRAHMGYLAAAPVPPDLATAQLLGDVDAASCTPIGLQMLEAQALLTAPVTVIPTPPITTPVPVVPPPLPPQPSPQPPPPPVGPPTSGPPIHPPIVNPVPVTPLSSRALPPSICVGPPSICGVAAVQVESPAPSAPSPPRARRPAPRRQGFDWRGTTFRLTNGLAGLRAEKL